MKKIKKSIKKALEEEGFEILEDFRNVIDENPDPENKYILVKTHPDEKSKYIMTSEFADIDENMLDKTKYIVDLVVENFRKEFVNKKKVIYDLKIRMFDHLKITCGVEKI